MFNTVVYSSEERVFYCDPVACCLLIFLHGLPQLIKRECLVDRHKAASQIIISRMQGYCKANSQAGCCEIPYAGHYTRSRDRNVSDAKISHIRIVKHPD